jgi:hypothetical protein
MEDPSGSRGQVGSANNRSRQMVLFDSPRVLPELDCDSGAKADKNRSSAIFDAFAFDAIGTRMLYAFSPRIFVRQYISAESIVWTHCTQLNR